MSTYSVGLVGESNYQEAIRACRAGERVEVVHEVGNPYDEQALAVVTGRGATIGYVPRSSWLRDAIHDEGQGCSATIRSVGRGERGLLGVVIEVTLNAGALASRAYSRAR
ncbi:MAG: HIRAN domain-containing protein [Pseudomonadota bacterium]|nr:HIRAN domain-containing protein [Pseudomonadota bacterium]